MKSKAGSGIVAFSDLSHWRTQGTADAVEWAKANTRPITPERLKDFEAGVLTGWSGRAVAKADGTP